jgi:AraC-like DNA-binding protein
MCSPCSTGGPFPTLPQTARALGLPARTLVRALAAEGHTHHRIVDVERRHRAMRLLARPDLPLAEIADLLGFSDQSSFGRKCRAWFDESPSSVRRRLTSGVVRSDLTLRPLLAQNVQSLARTDLLWAA